MATPIYADSAQKDREYKAGEKEVIVATLSDLDIVDEDNTPWDAVLQFRGDPDARGKYRRFIHWLDKELVGKPQSFVEDEIAGRLQDYTDALRKHGIRTICGMIRAALDPRHWPACDFAAVAAMLNDKPWWTAGLMIGKVCLSVATALLDHDDVKRGPNREIAYVYEA